MKYKIIMKNIYFGILTVCFLGSCSTGQKVHNAQVPNCCEEPPVKKNVGCLESPDNCKNRWGLYLYDNGDCYEGYFKDGKKHGSGTLYSKNSKKYGWKMGENVGEEGRAIGRTMEEKNDPINLNKSCEEFFPNKNRPKGNLTKKPMRIQSVTPYDTNILKNWGKGELDDGK
jgi:hypothetical protein